MITEIVFFELPKGISRETLMNKYLSTAQTWSKNTDLVQKYYFYDQELNRGGGIYIWKSKNAMRHWHGEEYRARIKEIYGSEPQITCFDALVHVNNIQGRIDSFESA